MSNSGQSSRSRHLVDPALGAMVDAIPPFDLSLDSLAEFRARPFPQPELTEAARDIEVTPHLLPAPGGTPDVSVALYRPRGASGALPVILHIHGGGYIGGSVAGTENRQRLQAADLGCAIISVDYRLAPETPYPGPLEDCYTALAWAVRSGADLGIDPSRLVLKGESAGGGLAAALALLTRDRGEFHPLHQHLTYPMLDDRTATTRAPHDYAGEFVWRAPDNLFGWTSLLGGAPGGEDVSPYAAPARATDLSNLPPAYIMTGALDLFADECTVYARRLMQAGISTEFHVYAGGFHGFDMAPNAEISVASRASSRAALARVLWPAT